MKRRRGGGDTTRRSIDGFDAGLELKQLGLCVGLGEEAHSCSIGWSRKLRLVEVAVDGRGKGGRREGGGSPNV